MPNKPFSQQPGLFSSTSAAKPSDDSNMIPLINIVFLMLIFFMVAGKITAKDAAQFEPPKTQAKANDVVEALSVIVTAERQLWLDNRTLGPLGNLSTADWQTLEQQIRSADAVILKADASLPASLLDPILKRLRKNGARKIQIAVQTAP